MTKPQAKKPHHHGHLREALVRAGVELLEDGGIEALTLRRCAALAGVSHAAPAHHFDGLGGLKRAIADEGFRRFRNYMVDAEVIGDQTPRGRLKSICRGYLRFARDNPALFGLIFGLELRQLPERSRNAQDIGGEGYAVLRRCCAPFVAEGEDPFAIETQVWSLIHGFTSLVLSGSFMLPGQPGEDVLFDHLLALLDRIGTDPAPLGNPDDLA